jgi:hypothetical protein
MPPNRETDRVLQRLRTLVHDSRHSTGANRLEREARGREIERLKSELAAAVKQTATTEPERL